jgi:hypothetical protein
MDVARGKRHVLVRGHLDVARHETDWSLRIGVEEVPLLVVSADALLSIWKVEHQHVARMVRQYRLAITSADGARPTFYQIADFVFRRHAGCSGFGHDGLP